MEDQTPQSNPEQYNYWNCSACDNSVNQLKSSVVLIIFSINMWLDVIIAMLAHAQPLLMTTLTNQHPPSLPALPLFWAEITVSYQDSIIYRHLSASDSREKLVKSSWALEQVWVQWKYRHKNRRNKKLSMDHYFQSSKQSNRLQQEVGKRIKKMKRAVMWENGLLGLN